MITLVNILLSGLVAFAVNAFSAREETLQRAASVSYVDKQDSAINSKLCFHDSQFINLENKVDTKSDKADLDKLQTEWTNRFNRIDLKSDEQYKMLVEILKTVKKLD